jgi:hypothetical protein
MQFIKAFWIALVSALICNVAILYLFRPLVINPDMPLHSLSLMPVAMLTVVGVIGAAAVFALMRRFVAKPVKPFIALSVVVLVASFVPDYLIIGMTTGPFAGADWGSALVLMLMHVVAAAAIVYPLVKVWGARVPVPEAAQK